MYAEYALHRTASLRITAPCRRPLVAAPHPTTPLYHNIPHHYGIPVQRLQRLPCLHCVSPLCALPLCVIAAYAA